MARHHSVTDDTAVLRMSPLSSDSRSYFDAIQNYFLERTGNGLVLSSRDLELLMDWRKSGASAALVCQGIDEAMQSLNRGPRDLHSCKRFVEPRLGDLRVDEYSRPARRSPEASRRTEESTSPADPWADALRRVDEARSTTESTALQTTYAELARRIREAKQTNADPYDTLFRFEDWIVDETFAALSEDERRRIDLAIEGRHGPRLSMMSDEGREQAFRAGRRRILRDDHGLIRLLSE